MRTKMWFNTFKFYKAFCPKEKSAGKPSAGFSPSVQMNLFQYLKPHQQMRIRPILRVLKEPAQVILATSLLDYMETGISIPPEENGVLRHLYLHIVNNGIVKPLTNSVL